MTNEIVGKSRDHDNSMGLQTQSTELQNKLNEVFQEQLNSHENRLINLEDTMRVNGIQEKKITESVNRVVVKVLGGKQPNAYRDRSVRGKAYAEINRRIKNMFGIPRRAELPAKDYDACMGLIEQWQPEYELRMMVEEKNSQMELIEA